MTGKELRDRLSDCGVSQSEIARRLNMSQQSFNQSLLVNDVKSGLLERIAQAIEMDMSFFYPIGGDNAVATGKGAVAAVKSSVTVGSDVLQERVKLLEQLLDEKERTIKILMDK